MISRVYLDASAIVRLLVEEPGWQALASFLADHEGRVTSVLSVTEVRRAVRRAAPSSERIARAEAVVDRLDLVALSPDLLRHAGDLEPASLRTLDALHLATALAVGPLAALVTYDARLADAAREHNLNVVAPG